LDHSYTSAQSDWDDLKNSDAAIAQALSESGAFDLFLVNVEHEEEGCDEAEEVYVVRASRENENEELHHCFAPRRLISVMLSI